MDQEETQPKDIIKVMVEAWVDLGTPVGHQFRPMETEFKIALNEEDRSRLDLYVQHKKTQTECPKEAYDWVYNQTKGMGEFIKRHLAPKERLAFFCIVGGPMHGQRFVGGPYTTHPFIQAQITFNDMNLNPTYH
jgi:hypothetical protein